MGIFGKSKGKQPKKTPPLIPQPPLPNPTPLTALVIENIDKPGKVTIANGFFSYGNVSIQTRNITAFSVTNTTSAKDNKKPMWPFYLQKIMLFCVGYVHASVILAPEYLFSPKDLPIPPLDAIPFLTLTVDMYHRCLIFLLTAFFLYIWLWAQKKIKSFAPQTKFFQYYFEVELLTPKRLIFKSPTKEFAEDFLKRIQVGIEHGRIKIVADFEGKKISVETVS